MSVNICDADNMIDINEQVTIDIAADGLVASLRSLFKGIYFVLMI